MRREQWAFVVLFFVALVLPAQAAQTKSPDISEYQLKNGLKLVVIPDRRAPVVTHTLWYKVGAADDPIGKSGIAHYLEHLMFKGTSNVPAGEFSAKIAEIGGQENAFTSADYTGYYQKITPAALESMMGYEADRMANLVLNDATVLPERDVILEERRQRIASSPGAILSETTRSLMFRHHPYGTPIIGWEHEMQQLTKEDAIAFYNRYYTPNNAIVVVAGDVEADAVLAMAERTYGKVNRKSDRVVRNRVREPEPTAARTATYRDRRVTIPSWRRSYLVPSYFSAQGNEAEALDILANIIGGSSTSRLHRKLVIEDKIATRVSTYYQGGALDLSTFSVSATPRGDATITALENAIDTILADIAQNGVSAEEVRRASNNLVKTTLFDQDSQTTMARLYGAVLAMGGTVDDVKNWPDEISRIGVEDVNRVARTYLKTERSVTGYLEPEVTN